MRILISLVLLLSLATLVHAAYFEKTVENHVAYSHKVSRDFSSGEFDDISGWRECLIETESENGEEIGILCEGTRMISNHAGRPIVVNYFCEFLFHKLEAQSYKVAHENCQ